MSLRSNGTFDSFFGDGSDGHINVSNGIVLSRDMFYDVLVMSGTSSTTPRIDTNSFRVYVRSKLIFMTSGTIANDGVGGANGLAGISPKPTPESGSLSSLGDGGDGSPDGTSNGINGGFVVGLGGYGGDGGYIGGFSISGFGGYVLAPDNVDGSVNDPFFKFLGYTFGHHGSNAIAGGAGGGGGSGDDVSMTGSGGGGGGGVLFVAAQEILIGLSGTYIEASSFDPGPPFVGTISPFSGTFFTTNPGVTASFTALGGAGEFGVTGQASGGGGGGGLVVIVTSTPAYGPTGTPFLTGTDLMIFEQPSTLGTLSVSVDPGSTGGGPFPGVNGASGTLLFYRV
jgi:hypothetical protein